MSLSLILIIQVTTDKVLVLSMIDDSRLIKRQVVVFTYFKKFVNSLDGNKLLSFLHYITGSSSIAVHAIKLMFHSHISNLQHVTVYPCLAVVGLPSSSYDGFTDFKTWMKL